MDQSPLPADVLALAILRYHQRAVARMHLDAVLRQSAQDASVRG